MNPDVLWCQLSLHLSASSHIPEIIFKRKTHKKDFHRQLMHSHSAISIIVCNLVNIEKADLEHLISDLPLQSRNALVISKLCDFLVPEAKQAKSL